MITPERLKEIEELAEDATNGPLAIELTCNMPEDARLFQIWEQSRYREGEPLAEGKNGNVGRLFTASRTVIPELIAEVKRLREVLNTLLGIEIKGHTIADRLQFSDIGRSILQDALGGEK